MEAAQMTAIAAIMAQIICTIPLFPFSDELRLNGAPFHFLLIDAFRQGGLAILCIARDCAVCAKIKIFGAPGRPARSRECKSLAVKV